MITFSTERDLAAYICDVTNGCAELTALLDASNPVRRMQRGVSGGDFVNILTYGRITRRRVRRESPGLYEFTVTFRPFIRGEAEASEMGDLILSDVNEILFQLFDIEQAQVEGCSYPMRNMHVLRTEFDDFQTEPDFDHEWQAWTQDTRFRFTVAVPLCRPVTTWCDECVST